MEKVKRNSKIKAAVVGARGYAGLELVRHLLRHPFAQVTEAYASKAFSLSREIENCGPETVNVRGEDAVLSSEAEILFLATPAEVSLKLVPDLLQQNKKVIDLSGAFRLRDHQIEDWYGFESPSRELLSQAHYGLVPFADPCPQGSFVSNPGCYATAVEMALIPLLKKKLIDPDQIVIDAKSGTSGAGRKAQEALLFTEVAGDCRPYRIGQHQHQPEIIEALRLFSGTQVTDLFFSTHLLPVNHGILASIYLRPRAGVKLADVNAAYDEAFAGYDLAKWGGLQERPELVSLPRAVNTPETRIAFELRDGKLFVFSCLDNRLKGAATQAIENLNRWMDWPVNSGLVGG